MEDLQAAAHAADATASRKYSAGRLAGRVTGRIGEHWWLSRSLGALPEAPSARWRSRPPPSVTVRLSSRLRGGRPTPTITNEGSRFVLMGCCRPILGSAAGNNESSPRSCRILVPGAAVQQAPACLRREPADLFEEQRNLHADAAIPQVTHPAQVQRPEIGAAFAADDHPVDAGQVEGCQRSEEGLEREEPDRGGGPPQPVRAPGVVVGFDRRAPPHVPQWPPRHPAPRPRAALR